MKILKLEIENLASLKGKHVLDFTAAPLHQCGLFLIAGPTGSGKTTLLDALSLALYNELPRMGKVSKRDIDQTGALVTRHTDHALARVTYRCATGTFISQWQISKNRNGNWRNYDFEVFDEAGNSMGLLRSEVAAFNAERIGLDYEQFTRAIVLAQGEFAQFLKSGEDQRAALLEKITGDRIYRQLGKAAAERASGLLAQDKGLKNQQEGLRAQVLEPDQADALSVAVNGLNTKVQSQQKEVNQRERALEIRKELNQAKSSLEERRTELDAAEARWTDWNRLHADAWARHQTLLPIESVVRKWSQATARLASAKTELLGLTADRTASHQKLESHLERAQAWMPTSIDRATVVEQLDALAESVRGVAKRLDQKKEEAATIRTHFKQHVEYQTKLKWSDDSTAEEWSTALDRNQTECAHQLAEAESQLAACAAPGLDEASAANWELRAEQWMQFESAWNSKNERATQIQSAVSNKRAQLAEVPDHLQALNQALLLAVSKEETAEAEWRYAALHAQVAAHRTELTAGHPCPLCGALEHPYAEDLPEVQPDDKKAAWNRAQKARMEAELSLKETQRKEQGLQDELKLLERELEGLKLDQLTAQLDEVKSAFPADWAEWGGERVRSRIREWVAATGRATEAAKYLDGGNEALNRLEQLEAVREEAGAIEQELKAVWPQDAEVDEAVNAWKLTWKLEHATLESVTQRMEREETAIRLESEVVEACEREAQPVLDELELTDLAEALAQLLDGGKAQQLGKEREQLNIDRIQAVERVNEQAKRVEDLIANDTQGSDETLELQAKTAKDQLHVLQAERDDRFAELQQHHGALKQIEALETKRVQLLGDGEKWLKLHALIGDAEGKKFNKFAQQLTMGQLLAIANRRLKGLSDRYRFADPDESGKLAVIDQHMAGERRGVSTLSGGETFLMSLGLALGLSDLASRNIQIGDLFIDEGFGTLDAEALEGVLDVLDRLQTAGGRNVGIISHVEGLKERVSTQVQLTPNGQGHSTLRVVPEG
jgi:exonuclease SbcC